MVVPSPVANDWRLIESKCHWGCSTPARTYEAIWVFPKIGVPQNGWFTMENHIKIHDLGAPLFLEAPIWSATFQEFDRNPLGTNHHQSSLSPWPPRWSEDPRWDLQVPISPSQQVKHCQALDRIDIFSWKVLFFLTKCWTKVQGKLEIFWICQFLESFCRDGFFSSMKAISWNGNIWFKQVDDLPWRKESPIFLG